MKFSSLRALSDRGLIPGPKESHEDFFERVTKTQFADYESVVPVEHWQSAFEITKRLFGFCPDWVSAHYSNDKLFFWEGAAVWLGPTFVIQLRENFRKGSYLGIYKRDEVLAHEAVHAARMAFEEPRFEEIFAYLTSSNKWRKITGPLLRSPKEALFFIAATGLSLLATLFLNDAFIALPFVMISLGFLRLVRTRRVFLAALARSKQYIQGNAFAFLLHLTDEEISLFAKATQEKIEAYIKVQDSIRWDMIREVFFGPLSTGSTYFKKRKAITTDGGV
jgi:hypothetical protein